MLEVGLLMVVSVDLVVDMVLKVDPLIVSRSLEIFIACYFSTEELWYTFSVHPSDTY